MLKLKRIILFGQVYIFKIRVRSACYSPPVTSTDVISNDALSNGSTDGNVFNFKHYVWPNSINLIFMILVLNICKVNKYKYDVLHHLLLKTFY